MGLSDCYPDDDDDNDSDDYDNDDDGDKDDDDNDDDSDSDDNDDDDSDDDDSDDDDADDGSSHPKRKSKFLCFPGGICSLDPHHPADLLRCTTFSIRTMLPRDLEQMGPSEK